MKQPTIDNSLTLKSVQQQFEAWRVSRTGRESIPGALWEAAIKLCQHHSRGQVCRALRLSFTELKKHLSKIETRPVRFTEFSLGSLTGPWQIECQRPDGVRLRFSGSGQPPALEALLREFLA